MANFRADFACNVQMVVDDEADVGAFGDGQNLFRHAPDFIGRRIFGAQLDQIAAAVAELLRDEFGRTAMQIGRVHEGVKFAVRERFHSRKLNNKGTKEQRKTLERPVSIKVCIFSGGGCRAATTPSPSAASGGGIFREPSAPFSPIAPDYLSQRDKFHHQTNIPAATFRTQSTF